MNTLCIYVIFDLQNKINAYIEPVLKEIKKFATDIVVVCNFEKIESGIEFIEPYAKYIYCRKNEGFDAGAYREAIIDLISVDNIKKYDELILTNDTYFAPFFSFDNIFKTMRDDKCDWWGITKHKKTKIEGFGDQPDHIQSYFLCFKNKVIQSDTFTDYWIELKNPLDKDQAIIRFEIGINVCLQGAGYVGKAYTDIWEPIPLPRGGENPYSCIAFELVRDYGVPLIKKTNFYGKNKWHFNALMTINYVKMHCDYNVALITDYVEEYRKKGLLGPYFDFENMEKFVRNHRRVFIYGAGNWGAIAAEYLKLKDLKYEGYIVTSGNGEGIIEYNNALLGDDDGVIIAQENKDVCDWIKEYIKDSVSQEHIFTPCYP